jgi:guanosine-3',5'-bis(diphosphate) 3'-pyrophosphohydrolase
MDEYEKLKNIVQARKLMEWAHKGQKRSKSKDPYCMHPMRVASMAASLGYGSYFVTAMLWHDILEDGPSEVKYNKDKLYEIATSEYGIDKSIVNPAIKIVDNLTQYENETKFTYLDKISKFGTIDSVIGKVLDRIDNISESKGDEWLKTYMVSTCKIHLIAIHKGLSEHPAVKFLEDKIEEIKGRLCQL